MRAVVLVGVAACYHYAPGSFTDPQGALVGTRATVGCLDVVVARGSDAAAEGPVVDLSFGNRCTHAASVDLRSVKVRTDGVALVAFDPRREIVPMWIDARDAGRESIEYQAAAVAPPAEDEPELGSIEVRVRTHLDPRLCVDIGRIDASQTGEQWICLR